MLIDVTVSNYKSIKTDLTLSFVAANLKELPGNLRNIVVAGRKAPMTLFTAAGVYGANASGKSTLLDALQCAASFICASASKYTEGEALPFQPFLLDMKTSIQPSSFAFTFVIDTVLYRYGFSADKMRIYGEWLKYWPQGRERVFFDRRQKKFSPDFRRSADIFEATRRNALVLSTGTMLNDELCKKMTRFFSAITPLKYEILSDAQKDILNIPDENREILSLLIKYADIGIEDIRKRRLWDSITGKGGAQTLFADQSGKNDTMETYIINRWKELRASDAIMSTLAKIKLHTIELGNTADPIRILFETQQTFFRHAVRCPIRNAELHTDFLPNQESDGTIKFLLLMNAVLNAFEKGGVLIIDELDAKLHLLLAAGFLKFFQQSGNVGTQILFSTHAADLLDADVLRRDQIYITQKDQDGATTLISLSDYTAPKNAELGKRYLEGRYGGIPYLHEGYLQEAQREIERRRSSPTRKDDG